MKPVRRSVATAAIALTMLAGGVAVTAAIADAATAGCRVDYTVTSQWSGGFTGAVTVTNLGDPVNGWTLSWNFAAGQAVTQAWNATVSQSGTAATAANLSYNGSIATNGTAAFGFNGSWTTGNPVPAGFALNGTPCTPTPGPSPCAPPSTTSPVPSTSPSRTPTATPSTSGAPTAGGTPSPTPTPSPSTPAPQPAVTVWLAGDSTVANPSGGVCPVGWGSQFAPYFNSKVTVKNNAVAGRSIQTWLYERNVSSTTSAGECVISPATYAARWQAMLDPSTGMKAGDYLLIQFGINDSDPACPRHVGPARYRELLGVMAAAAKQRGVYPIFLTPVAAITCSGATATGNRAFLTDTTAAGSANGVPVIDLHKLSYTLYTSIGLCPNNGDYAQGAVGAFFCADHTHFETAGATQIAKLVTSALRNQKVPLAAYLK